MFLCFGVLFCVCVLTIYYLEELNWKSKIWSQIHAKYLEELGIFQNVSLLIRCKW